MDKGLGKQKVSAFYHNGFNLSINFTLAGFLMNCTSITIPFEFVTSSFPRKRESRRKGLNLFL